MLPSLAMPSSSTDSPMVSPAKPARRKLKEAGRVLGPQTFGLWGGCDRPFRPDTTSYDYDAPVGEAGRMPGRRIRTATRAVRVARLPTPLHSPSGSFLPVRSVAGGRKAFQPQEEQDWHPKSTRQLLNWNGKAARYPSVPA
jgi:hypothetical protein